MNRGRRLQAPREDRTWLVEPPFAELPATVAANIAARATRDSYELNGTTLGQLADAARADLVRDALHDTQQYRDVDVSSALRAPSSALLLAGHQPELFHPGVWAKNFALAKLAENVGAVPINLVIDGDTQKSASLRVPTGTVDEPHVETVPFDGPSEEIPHEERRVVDEATFASFGERAAEILKPFVAAPLLERFWPTVVAQHAQGATLGESIARARHAWEGSWGVQTLEYRQSRMCETVGFRRFALHLLAELPRFHASHNGALADYKRQENIRSANHPVPALAGSASDDDAGLEAPLWLWTAANPRRRRVFVRRIGRELELSDRAEVRVRLPHGESGDVAKAVEALDELAAQGIKLRSKALLTTMYARLVLGDLFLHGIGGGKYDELTDEIIRRFFGFAPPGYGIVTATRRLPIPLPPRSDETEASLRHELWELAHHPERFLLSGASGEATSGDAARWIGEKRRWMESEPTRETARERCHAIREANVALQGFTADQVARTQEKLVEARRRARADAILTSREFSSFLFPEKDLREFLLAFPREVR